MTFFVLPFHSSIRNDTEYRDYYSFMTLGGYDYLQKGFFELLTTTVMISLKRLFQRFNTVSNSD
jgi:hypothetical protein